MTTTHWIILGIVVLAVLVGVFFILRRRAPVEEETFHFNCPGCKRRFGFREKQSGHAAECPRCKTQFKFPLVKSSR
jgi:hypothetical protein